MLVYVCAHILIFFLFTGLIPVYRMLDSDCCSALFEAEPPLELKLLFLEILFLY